MNENLHEISNDELINFDTSINLNVKSTVLPHCNIWISPAGKTHNKISHMLIDRGRNSSVLDVRSFR